MMRNNENIELISKIEDFVAKATEELAKMRVIPAMNSDGNRHNERNLVRATAKNNCYDALDEIAKMELPKLRKAFE